MAEPKSLTVAQLFTGLTGRCVSCTQVLKPSATQAKQAFGLYLVKPKDETRIVQLDLPLLGSFGGALLGLPSSAVKERLAYISSDEPLRDAVHEVLNVVSTIVTVDERAVFEAMYLDAALLPKAMSKSLKGSAYRSYFEITIDGYEGGAFSLVSPI